jgi:adenosine deaminase
LYEFFKNFPAKYREEHIHLTGSLEADFIFKKLQPILNGPHQKILEKKITEVYGPQAWPLDCIEKVDSLIRLKEGEGFSTYLKILYLGKVILTDREAHAESAYSMASAMYHKHNVGQIRLKFSLSRASTQSIEQMPSADQVPTQDVVWGLYEGFSQFKKEHPDFNFVLSPSFRKEKEFFDSAKFNTRKAHFEHQVEELIKMIDQHPDLAEKLTDVDTVGDETGLYRKEHFNEFKRGLRRLQSRGLKIRSHHGETFHNLRRGIQAVDNAMNIWHIDTLEHGLSLGINPNFYFHRLFQRVWRLNQAGIPVDPQTSDFRELEDFAWEERWPIFEKLKKGEPLTSSEKIKFLKTKFHQAKEIEHYQHDVLNRVIQKGVNLVSLPSSNNKLTGQLEDYKDHPFSWWEKKGVHLGLGTDNYVTLNTDYLQEMMILLVTDPKDLKITKLLMVATGETRRPYISHLLWKMRKAFVRSKPNPSKS